MRFSSSTITCFVSASSAGVGEADRPRMSTWPRAIVIGVIRSCVTFAKKRPLALDHLAARSSASAATTAAAFCRLRTCQMVAITIMVISGTSISSGDGSSAVMTL